MSRLRALATNMAAVITAKAATGVAGLLTMVVLTRHLGPTEFGYYRTVLTYSAFAAVLGDSGLYMVTLRRMSQDSAAAARILGNALPLRVVTTGSVLLAAAAVAWLTPYDPPVKWGTLIGAAIYTCLQASDFLIAAFQSVLKQARNAVAEVTGALVTLAAVSILTLTHVGALPMLAATLLGAITALAISIRLARRLVPFRVSFDLPVWRQYLIAGLPLAGAHAERRARPRGVLTPARQGSRCGGRLRGRHRDRVRAVRRPAAGAHLRRAVRCGCAGAHRDLVCGGLGGAHACAAVHVGGLRAATPRADRRYGGVHVRVRGVFWIDPEVLANRGCR